MTIHTENLGPGGTEQPVETNYVLKEKPSQKIVRVHKENPYILPTIILLAIPLWIIAIK
jgi:hypothetical protein